LVKVKSSYNGSNNNESRGTLKMRKRFQTLSIIMGAIAGLAGGAYYMLFRRPLPQKKGMLHLDGISTPVEILRDKWGVPHIYAQNENDLFFSQGYIHADERLWQMDFNRRMVAGRLSEILGPRAIPLDRWMRTLGMRRIAEQEALLVTGIYKEIIQSYAAGVNARISQGRLPLEFSLLRCRPEPWTIADSFSWAKMMAWNLSVNWEAELLRALIINKLGAEKASELEPGGFEEWPLIIPDDVDFSKFGKTALKKAAEARQKSGPGSASGLGSNNWVISGAKTISGKPILANDMHLSLTVPAIWFENHLCGGALDVTGVSFPGIPGVIAGHNSHVAWGFTNGFPDVQDLYVEHIKREEDRVLFEYRGEWLDATVRKESIKVRGQEPVIEEVVETRHGPIINSLFGESGLEDPLALRWTAYEPHPFIDAIYGMNRAHNYESFRVAIQSWTVPVQNIVYADIQGNIAYFYPGLVPIRAKGDGRLPVPGWSGEYEWEGYIPFDELPHFLNPAQGYIATANNRVVGPAYPYWLGCDFVTGNRAKQIVNMIKTKEKIDLRYVQEMQTNLVSTAAKEITQYFSEIATSDPELRMVLDRLIQWDGDHSQVSAEATVYQVFCLQILEKILKPRLGADLAERYMGKGPTPILTETSIFGERSREFLRQQMSQPDSNWFNLGNGETRDELILQTLRQTVDYLKNNYGPGIDDWAWGKVHTLTLTHSLGSNPAPGKIFNRGPYDIGGDADTIWQSQATRYNLKQSALIGPPYRMIVDFQNLSDSVSQLLPGQSGHPASSHYADNIDAWLNGKYHPMLFRFAEVNKNAEARLRLEP
jgi:penicillin amidase